MSRCEGSGLRYFEIGRLRAPIHITAHIGQFRNIAAPTPAFLMDPGKPEAVHLILRRSFSSKHPARGDRQQTRNSKQHRTNLHDFPQCQGNEVMIRIGQTAIRTRYTQADFTRDKLDFSDVFEPWPCQYGGCTYQRQQNENRIRQPLFHLCKPATSPLRRYPTDPPYITRHEQIVGSGPRIFEIGR